MSHRLLESLAHRPALGVRLRDVVTGQTVVDGVLVHAIAPYGRRTIATASPSGVFSTRALPGLREWELRGVGPDGSEDPATTVELRLVRLEVRDVFGRFHSFCVEADVPTGRLITATCGSPPLSPPDDDSLPLYSLPSRPAAASMAVVRARLAYASDGRPAAFACIEVTAPTSGESFRGIADRRGEAVVMFPYPKLPRPASPELKRSLAATTWPLEVRIFAPEHPVPPDGELPNLCAFLEQLPVPIVAQVSPPEDVRDAMLEFGRELVLRSSADDPVLLIGA